MQPWTRWPAEPPANSCSASVTSGSSTGAVPRCRKSSSPTSGSRRTALLAGVALAEKISPVPDRPHRILRDLEPREIGEPAEGGGGLEIESGLLHVILRLVIACFFPLLEDLLRLDRRV